MEIGNRSALNGDRYRVVVSTDIGGTDPDDIQSMVHLLVYADCSDIEGLVSSPYGSGRKEHILEAIDCSEKDYANLKTYPGQYPTPDALRAITKQGEIERAPYAGMRSSTEGSQWIVECAWHDDPRQIHVLVWGVIEDLALALHDAPDILAKLRAYWIDGSNKKWSPDAYQYIATHHSKLWIIEYNATYRGLFVGGDLCVYPTGGRTIHQSIYRKENTSAPRQLAGGARTFLATSRPHASLQVTCFPQTYELKKDSVQ